MDYLSCRSTPHDKINHRATSGSRGAKDAPPRGQNFLIFMMFLKNKLVKYYVPVPSLYGFMTPETQAFLSNTDV